MWSNFDIYNSIKYIKFITNTYVCVYTEMLPTTILSNKLLLTTFITGFCGPLERSQLTLKGTNHKGYNLDQTNYK